jgi:hypothetical protein
MKKSKALLLIIGISLILTGCFNSITEYDYSAKKVTERSGATSWIFEGKYKPPVNLKVDSSFISDVNLALTKLNLPKISYRVIEKEKITGSRAHRGKFEWMDYPQGKLTVNRSTTSDVNYDRYNCIWKVTISKK